MSALAFTLDYVQGIITGGLFPNGGSIGIAMLPILFISYRRGLIAGLVSGLLVSVLQMIPGISTVPGNLFVVISQVMLDYIVAYPLVGIAGAFAKGFKSSDKTGKKITYLITGTVLGGSLKLLAHYLAGVIFWADYCPNWLPGGAFINSFLYNGAYMIPNIIINGALLVLMALKAPMLFKTEKTLK